ncbi:MAG: helix-turn-helix domain-containing protein [Spirochaetaceae bacterium]|jgi:transcriptional regulator with XRE-family HTH domain|nr:helix-turn-helix domain-containing protein [Spirochaetaceae bacterium]
MDNIRETFARNLRENRRKCGLTQAQLAEKAEVSTHYIALIELARNIPKVDTIERLANALNVEIYELFIVPLSPAMEIKKLQESVIAKLKDIVKESVDEAFEQERKRQKKRKQ